MHSEPLARFQDPICPGILGLPRGFAEAMVDRIRFDARRLRIDAAAETVLSLFDPGGARPAELTAFDLADLRSVYGSLPNLPALTRLGGVAREVRREVAEQDARPER